MLSVGMHVSRALPAVVNMSLNLFSELWSCGFPFFLCVSFPLPDLILSFLSQAVMYFFVCLFMLFSPPLFVSLLYVICCFLFSCLTFPSPLPLSLNLTYSSMFVLCFFFFLSALWWMSWVCVLTHTHKQRVVVWSQSQSQCCSLCCFASLVKPLEL